MKRIVKECVVYTQKIEYYDDIQQLRGGDFLDWFL